jgi:hypothetical protein
MFAVQLLGMPVDALEEKTYTAGGKIRKLLGNDGGGCDSEDGEGLHLC